ASPSPIRGEASAASPRGWSRRRTRLQPVPGKSARVAPHSRSRRSLLLLQVLVHDFKQPVPTLPLAFYPIGGLGECLWPQGEAVSPAVDDACDDARRFQHLQVT